ncbi:hypothetical protein NT6N_04490 [Oceaniferula spumae]|uniref:Uncharacterized protein n=1 Tax=Oceaniferula spumae TaxID=2979115 RepID=A0AAT9FHH1_9BACT
MQALGKWDSGSDAQWYDKQDAEGRPACNLFVANSLRDIGKTKNLIGGDRYPLAREWFAPNLVDLESYPIVWNIEWKNLIKDGKRVSDENGRRIKIQVQNKGKRKPRFGDILATQYHCGVCLSGGAYLSASTNPGAGSAYPGSGVAIRLTPDARGSRTSTVYREVVSDSK